MIGTDVGDSKLIVGETGVLVPSKNSEALSAGLAVMVERLSENPQLPDAVRERTQPLWYAGPRRVC